MWGEVRERAAIDVRGRERSRVLCFYGVSDVAACWNPRGMVSVRYRWLGECRADDAAVACTAARRITVTTTQLPKLPPCEKEEVFFHLPLFRPRDTDLETMERTSHVTPAQTAPSTPSTTADAKTQSKKALLIYTHETSCEHAGLEWGRGDRIVCVSPGSSGEFVERTFHLSCDMPLLYRTKFEGFRCLTSLASLDRGATN